MPTPGSISWYLNRNAKVYFDTRSTHMAHLRSMINTTDNSSLPYCYRSNDDAMLKKSTIEQRRMVQDFNKRKLEGRAFELNGAAEQMNDPQSQHSVFLSNRTNSNNPSVPASITDVSAKNSPITSRENSAVVFDNNRVAYEGTIVVW